MQSLENIKKRIKSVQTTSKITGAMKLIATANIRKQAKEYDKIASFCKDFYNIVKPLVSSTDDKKLNPKNENTLYILITSSMGLCGAFNINITKYLIEKIKPNDKIIVFGKKGYSYLKSHGLESKVIHTIEVSSKNISYLEILPTSAIIMEMFAKEQFGKIKMVYTKFINSMTFSPVEIQILPFDKTLFNNEQSDKASLTSMTNTNDKKQIIEYESPRHHIFESILPTFITTIIFAGIIESQLCESGSRRNAMDTATKNAKELIDNLVLQFNRARQEKITQEINEIVAGGTANE